jgi:hypothetical protein
MKNKEIEVKRKKCKLVMLPTEDKTQIFTSKRDNVLHYHFKGHTPNNVKSYQHLYITSDDEIKEGDWRMITDKSSSLYGQFEQKKSNIPENEQWSKIIATTHNYLNLPCSCLGKITGQEKRLKKFVTYMKLL